MRHAKLVVGLTLFFSVTFGACKCGTSRAIRSILPELTVDPDRILFKQSPVGILQQRDVRLTNTGAADLELAEPTVTESDGDGLTEIGIAAGSLTKDCLDRVRTNRLKLSPGECAKLTVRYVPKNVDDDGGALVLRSNDSNGEKDVPIGLAPMHLQFCAVKPDGSTGDCADPRDPEKLVVDFGVATLGSPSAPRDLLVRNVGDVTVNQLSVKRTGSSDYKLDSTGLPAQLTPGQSARLHVTLTASQGGTRLGAVMLSSKEDPDLAAKLTATGDAPGLCVDPINGLDFGAVAIGSHKDLTVTLSSCGTKGVQLNSVTLPASIPFTPPNALPSAQFLAPQTKVAILIRYAPTLLQPDSGLLHVSWETSAGDVPLIGRGVDAPGCKLESSSTTLDFGQVAKGYSADRPLNIVNRGTQPCDLTDMAVTTGSPIFLPKAFPANYPLSVAPGGSVTYQFTYSPPANDTNTSDTGTVTFTNTDPHYAAQKGQLIVPLTGSPTASVTCKLQITPDKGGSGFGGLFGGGRILQFGQVLVNHTEVMPATFTNVGSIPCNITDIKFSALDSVLPGAPGGNCSGQTCLPFSLLNPPATPFTLNPGGQQLVNVQYAPTPADIVTDPGGGGGGPDLLPKNFLQVQTSDTSDFDGKECSLFPGLPGLPGGGGSSGPGCVQFGLAAAPSESDLTVLPSSLDFGLITLGCRSPSKSVTLYNTGSAAIEINGFSLSPATAPYYIVSPPLSSSSCPSGAAACIMLEGGKSTTITVTFKPSLAGAQPATLLIEARASNTSSKNPYISVSLAGIGTADANQTDTFKQADHPVADVLWVIDMDSNSMQAKQQAIHDNAEKFIKAADVAGTDYHLGVIASYLKGDEKTNCGNGAGCTTNSSYNNVTIHPGTLYHDNGAPSWVSRADANPVKSFADNARIGLTSDAYNFGVAQGLEAMYRALNIFAQDYPADNKGFLRDEARLIVISISDDDDESPQDPLFYARFLQSLKPGRTQDVVFDTVGGDFPGGCGNGEETGGDEPTLYHQVTAATGGKMYSICADYSQIASDLSLGSFGGRTHFALSRPCDPSTLSVTVNGAGQAQGGDYSFDPNLNAIDFKTAPAAGATIVASYSAQCL